MFQLSNFEQVGPVLREQLQSSGFFPSSPILRWSWIKCHIFQVDHTFYELDMNILASNNKISCVGCSQLSISSKQ